MKTLKFIKINTLLALILFFVFLIGYAQQNTTKNYDANELLMARNNLSSTLTLNRDLIQVIVGNNNYNSVSNLGIASEIFVDDSKFEFVYKDKKNNPINTITVNYTYLLDLKMKIHKLENRLSNGSTSIESHLKIGNVTLMVNWQNNLINTTILRNLKQIQSSLNEKRFNIAHFKNIVTKARLAKEPLTQTEEQRKYIIKANTFTQLSEYQNAIEAYQKALAINPTNYPEAYYNLALLSAELDKLYTAIDYMEKYVLLNEGTVNEVAKSKLDEWKFMLEN